MTKNSKKELVSIITFLNRVLSQIEYKYGIDIKEEVRLKQELLERLRNESKFRRDSFTH